MATVFDYKVRVGGDVGTDCDYASLNLMRTAASGAAIDLTATTATKVYAGTKTGTIADGAHVHLYHNNTLTDPLTEGNVHHCNYAGTAILIRDITEGTAVTAGDEWRVDASNLFTVSNTGDSAIVTVGCSTTGAADTTTPGTWSWTTNAPNYFEIYADAGHTAGTKWSTTKYRIETTDAVAISLGANMNGVRLTGLQIGGLASAGGLAVVAISGAGVLDARVSRCLMHGHASNYQTVFGCSPASSAGSTIKFWNNIIYGMTGLEGTAAYFAGASTTLYCYNNTCTGCTRALRVGSLYAMYVLDNITNCTINYVGTFTNDDANCDYNSSSTTLTTNGTHDLAEQAFTFVAADDFALTVDDAGARDHGINPGTYAGGALDFENDILGNIRTGTWDIGAHEYGAGAVSQNIGGACRLFTMRQTGTIQSDTDIIVTGVCRLNTLRQVSNDNLSCPHTIFISDSDAQSGNINPVNIITAYPHMSVFVTVLDQNVTQIYIQVSSVDDADFSETPAWDSGWLVLSNPLSGNDRINPDIIYGG